MDVKDINPSANKNNVIDDDLNAEYLDTRYITICVVSKYSNYRKVNAASLGVKKEVIGSSFSSGQILSSNRGEVETYMPSIIGLSVNNPDFVRRVKEYLSNIKCIVNGEVKLNVSFIYNTKKDYLTFKKRFDDIEKRFEQAVGDRTNLSIIKTELKRKCDDINAIESEKYKYGHPVSIEEYLLYRHCILYKDVAKDTALINSDPSYRFFIKDDEKENERKKVLLNNSIKAMNEFVRLAADPVKLKSVYINVVKYNNDNMDIALTKSEDEIKEYVMNFVNTNPDRFNKFIGDKNIDMKAFIEKLIVLGDLVRSEFNQQISTSDGIFIGANLNDAVAYFANKDNKSLFDALTNRLKQANI